MFETPWADETMAVILFIEYSDVVHHAYHNPKMNKGTKLQEHL
jgi:hypothetical protein